MGCRAVFVWAVCSLAACSFEPQGIEDIGATDDAANDGSEGDGAVGPDAADVDASVTDAAPIDAAAIDATLVDARLIDAAPSIDARPIDAGVPRCVGYQTVAGAPATSRYRRVNTFTTWPNASTNCTSDGGHLIIPNTNAEAVAVHGFVAPDSGSPFYWAGISDSNQDGTWITVLGQTVANPPFASGQPNARPDEIYILVASNGQFFDWFDYGTQEYACECVP